MRNLHELDDYREPHPFWPQSESAGSFRVYVNGRSFHVLASVDKTGERETWEHISVTPRNQKRCPTWDEMAAIKDMFFYPEEEAVQFHPKHSKYVNQNEYCLHIWRPTSGELLKSPEDDPVSMDTLSERDAILEKIWDKFSDVPMDPETEKNEEMFMGWPAGTDREDIWHWFDRRHSKGIAYLLYRQEFDRTPETAKLLYMKSLCFECESCSCQFNHGGECRFAMVHERKPRINDYDGCIDYDYQEGEE